MSKEEFLKQVEEEKIRLNIDASSEDDLYICEDCGSLNIETKHWVSPNTMRVSDSCEEDVCWCNQCLKSTYWITLSQYLVDNYV